MHVLREKRFSTLEMLGLLALGIWGVQGIGHALTVPGIAPGEVAKASDVQQIVDAVTALEAKLQYVQIVEGPLNGLAGPHVIVEGANFHVRSGAGSTHDGGSLTGLGNLVVGYNEADALSPKGRGGSHNLVIGVGHDYTSHAGLVAGQQNEILAPNTSVVGGALNAAQGVSSSVTGGTVNSASGNFSAVSGGTGNAASEDSSSVSGGGSNTASGPGASVCGGRGGEASGVYASVSGGRDNAAGGESASVTGGLDNVASATYASVSGGRLNEASGARAVVVGGVSNEAAGADSAILGGGGTGFLAGNATLTSLTTVVGDSGRVYRDIETEATLLH